jgi:putative endonuclease
LVYYEVFEDMENAILKEKQIKAGSRQKKSQLINSANREWRDLHPGQIKSLLIGNVLTQRWRHKN